MSLEDMVERRRVARLPVGLEGGSILGSEGSGVDDECDRC